MQCLCLVVWVPPPQRCPGSWHPDRASLGWVLPGSPGVPKLKSCLPATWRRNMNQAEMKLTYEFAAGFMNCVSPEHKASEARNEAERPTDQALETQGRHLAPKGYYIIWTKGHSWAHIAIASHPRTHTRLHTLTCCSPYPLILNLTFNKLQ